LKNECESFKLEYGEYQVWCIQLQFDVLLLHPPSLLDFRKKVWFPGPVARTVRSTPIFTTFPIGLMSIADLLDREGYAVKIVNIGEKMLLNPKFEAATYLEMNDAKIFGIDLHWCVHVQGAIELARICKETHPESLVVLGGLTSTCFKEEIIQKYPFIDAVIGGESEEAMLKLTSAIGKDRLDKVPNILYKDKDGKIRINQTIKPTENLDNYEFTRIDLVDQPTQLFYTQIGNKRLKLWHIPICRGCLFNCKTCGGSSYSYKHLFSRSVPAFRSIEKITEDFQRLDEQGFNSIFLFQDVRMGGKNYWKNLFKTLHKQHWSKIEHVTMEAFYPLDHEFTQTLHRFKPTDKVSLTMSPESGVDKIRYDHGRNYSNESIIKTAKACIELDLPITFFFLGVLAQETTETLSDTVKLWERLLSFKKGWINVEYGPMVILDPGSIAFNNPEREGYVIKNKTISSYYEAASKPTWVDWLNYETQNFNVEDMKKVILKIVEQLIKLKLKHKRTGEKLADIELKNLAFNKFVLEEIDNLNQTANYDEKENRLKELKEIEKDPLLFESYIMTHD